MNISVLLSSYNNKSGELANDINTKVSNALALVVQNYILTLSSSFVLTLGCTQLCSFFNSILENVFDMWGIALLQIVVVKKPIVRVPGPRDFNLIFVDTFEMFADMNIASYTALNNHNENYFIFLQTFDALAFGEMRKIFKYCWHHQLINCDVLLQNYLGDITVYTYYPFTANECGSVEPVLINRFNGSAFEFREMFPRKLLNFHGCTLRAALWDIPPYVSLKTDKNGITTVVGGFEGNLLLELSRKLNFTLNVTIPANGEQRGRFINNEWNGALGMLHKRVVDLSMGCFLKTPSRDNNASSLSHHYLSTQIICVPKSAYIFTPAEVLFYPFTTGAWLLILLIFASSFLLLNLFKRLEYAELRSSHSLFDFILVFVGMPFSEVNSRLHSRLFWTTWLLFTLILRAVYQSLLFHIIRTRSTNRIPKDLTELLAKNYTMVINISTWETLNHNPFLEIKKRVLHTILDMIAFEEILKEPSRRVAAIGPSEFLYYYIRSAKKDGAFAVLSDKVVNMPFTIYFTKHSYLINEFYEQAMWIRSCGFLEIWSRNELRVYKQQTQAVDESPGFKELYIFCMIGMSGLAIATFVFILELLSKRYATLKQMFSQI